MTDTVSDGPEGFGDTESPATNAKQAKALILQPHFVSGGTDITSTHPGFMKIQQTAKYLGVSVRTVRNWVRRRVLRVYKPTPRTLLFKAADIDACLKKFASGGVL